MHKFVTDWLGSQPVFYNIQTRQVNYNINKVIDFPNLEFDAEGLNNYLDFGYSVFGQTPIKNVKFLEPCSELFLDDKGTLTINQQEDPTFNWSSKTSSEVDVLNALQKSVTDWEKSVSGEIVLPLSGGYDSRLLAYFIEDKSRLRAFTYGGSDNQAESFEVVTAKSIAEVLGIQWQQIELGYYHNYFGEWNDLFGISVHAHGMYHNEFYKKLCAFIQAPGAFLSGIIGDAWAGAISCQNISNSMELVKIGYRHGLYADMNQCLLETDFELRNSFWEKHKAMLQTEYWQTIWLIRLKMILLSYLFTLPKIFGFSPWSPYLEADIALGMLTLPPDRRQDRIWQKEFFQKHDLLVENLNLRSDSRNTLNRQAMKNIRLQPLNGHLLNQVINPDYINWINKLVCNPQSLNTSITQLLYMFDIGKFIGKSIKGLLRKTGVKDYVLEAYSAYLTLKPIEFVLKKRDKAQSGSELYGIND